MMQIYTHIMYVCICVCVCLCMHTHSKEKVISTHLTDNSEREKNSQIQYLEKQVGHILLLLVIFFLSLAFQNSGHSMVVLKILLRISIYILKPLKLFHLVLSLKIFVVLKNFMSLRRIASSLQHQDNPLVMIHLQGLKPRVA